MSIFLERLTKKQMKDWETWVTTNSDLALAELLLKEGRSRKSIYELFKEDRVFFHGEYSNPLDLVDEIYEREDKRENGYTYEECYQEVMDSAHFKRVGTCIYELFLD